MSALVEKYWELLRGEASEYNRRTLEALVEEVAAAERRRIYAVECMPTDADERRYLDAFLDRDIIDGTAEENDANVVFLIRTIIRNTKVLAAKEREEILLSRLAEAIKDAPDTTKAARAALERLLPWALRHAECPGRSATIGIAEQKKIIRDDCDIILKAIVS